VSDRPAGFWRRYAAWTLDAALIATPAMLLGWSTLRAAAQVFLAAFAALSSAMSGLLMQALQSAQPPILLVQQWLGDPVLRQPVEALSSAVSSLLLSPLIIFIALSLVYQVAFERSPWQATPGKRALGLSVVDETGRRLPAGHVLLRFLAGGLSWLTLNIGHAMAALPPQHLALHDRLSSTRVVRHDDAPMPLWARAWIALQWFAFLALNIWLLRTAMRAMQSGFDQLS
jgi:uncharacterized RDD family membrane protein YckC